MPAAPKLFVALAVSTVAVFTLCCTLAVGAAHHGYPSCDLSVVQSSGYIDIPGVGGTQKHYFYWLFGPRRWPRDGSRPPVIMWMQGGPGCSSTFGLLVELGPCLMNETSGELYRNAYGWNDEAYLLFVDQSAGVGFSYADKVNYDHNESEAAEDMYNFLQGFAKRFLSPSITGGNDLYITGESYAGHYIPALAHRIVVGNQRGDKPKINLKGIAIGNGWTDPYTQFPSYVTIAYEWCKEKLGAPCITAAARDDMEAKLPQCLELIRTCNSFPNDGDASCARAKDVCDNALEHYKMTGLNSYDIRKPCITDDCYNTSHADNFLRLPEVVRAVGAKSDIVYEGCSAEVGKDFSNDIQRNFNYTFPPMLAAGIRVLIYAGDMDFICNWIGSKAWVTALEWPGKAAFNAAPDVEFSVNGRAAGQERTYGNFSFVRIYDAGHMVPMDQPEVSLYMMRRFLYNQKIAA
ncbi:serine carboxypeptidase (CBP1) [Lotmaria passim]